uniref:Vitronectin a n=1 Tax=Cyprinus carpio carpio TaxID=630221 RepID=A0A9J8BX94_CYPCA
MRLFLLLGLISFTYAAEESCIEGCENGFDATKSFQCDSMCTYYKSCCKDYESLCRIRSKFTSLCKTRPFDSFMQLKNGSLYAFRGKCLTLDEKSVLPGYPKLIEDIWGIKGPIDFTCINCQGKTYIFKGKKYWRFEDGDLRRYQTIWMLPLPFLLTAIMAKRRFIFFKGDQYYQYEFKHQPSHEECIQMSLRSPSALFRRYTNIYYDRWVEHFNHHHNGHHFINKDWTGIKSPLDAVLAGRLYITPRWRQDRYRQDWDQQWGQQYTQQWDQRYWQQWDHQWGSRRRQNRSPYWETMAERGISIGREFAQRFGQDRHMYYRVNLRTKRVDYANSPYPRPIGKYWLGCKDKPGAEKR